MPGTPSVQGQRLDSDTADSPPCLGSLTWFLRSIQGRLQRWGRTSPSGAPVSMAAWDVVALGSRERRAPARLKELRAIEVAEALEERGDEASPPGLMAGAHTGTVVPMGVGIEQEMVAPLRIGLALPRPAKQQLVRSDWG